jgi:hypothetical protein
METIEELMIQLDGAYPNETGLRRILNLNFDYYYQWARTHLSLDKDAPISGPSSWMR